MQSCCRQVTNSHVWVTLECQVFDCNAKSPKRFQIEHKSSHRCSKFGIPSILVWLCFMDDWEIFSVELHPLCYQFSFFLNKCKRQFRELEMYRDNLINSRITSSDNIVIVFFNKLPFFFFSPCSSGYWSICASGRRKLSRAAVCWLHGMPGNLSGSHPSDCSKYQASFSRNDNVSCCGLVWTQFVCFSMIKHRIL